MKSSKRGALRGTISTYHPKAASRRRQIQSSLSYPLRDSAPHASTLLGSSRHAPVAPFLFGEPFNKALEGNLPGDRPFYHRTPRMCCSDPSRSLPRFARSPRRPGPCPLWGSRSSGSGIRSFQLLVYYPHRPSAARATLTGKATVSAPRARMTTLFIVGRPTWKKSYMLRGNSEEQAHEALRNRCPRELWGTR